MIEVVGDLWTYPADIRCITTNGDVNRFGHAVMGRGCALQAKKKWPGIEKELGELLRSKRPDLPANRVHMLGKCPDADWYLWTFPVKHHWHEKADLDLIASSCNEVMHWAGAFERFYERVPVVVIPRPGCGNGQRDWETEVKPICSDLLDDRFHIITNT